MIVGRGRLSSAEIADQGHHVQGCEAEHLMKKTAIRFL
jgi:hypothetical protein